MRPKRVRTLTCPHKVCTHGLLAKPHNAKICAYMLLVIPHDAITCEHALLVPIRCLHMLLVTLHNAIINVCTHVTHHTPEFMHTCWLFAHSILGSHELYAPMLVCVCAHIPYGQHVRVFFSWHVSIPFQMRYQTWWSNISTIAIPRYWCATGWLRVVGSFKLWVSFAEYSLFYRALLQKRLIIWRSLLIVATPYELCVLLPGMKYGLLLCTRQALAWCWSQVKVMWHSCWLVCESKKH